MKKFLATLLALTMLLTSLIVPAMAESADAHVVIIGAGGAGLSSNRIMNAVALCLQQAAQ